MPARCAAHVHSRRERVANPKPRTDKPGKPAKPFEPVARGEFFSSLLGPDWPQVRQEFANRETTDRTSNWRRALRTLPFAAAMSLAGALALPAAAGAAESTGVKPGLPMDFSGSAKASLGSEIDYEGASGSVDLDGNGDLRAGHVGIWRFSGVARAAASSVVSSGIADSHAFRLPTGEAARETATDNLHGVRGARGRSPRDGSGA